MFSIVRIKVFVCFHFLLVVFVNYFMLRLIDKGDEATRSTTGPGVACCNNK